MAVPSARLVLALRDTAARLASPAVTYQWSHFGHCNCGHLAQTITGLPAAAIYRAAFERSGDWGQQAAEVGVPERAPAPDYADRPALDEGAFEPLAPELCGATGSPLEQVFAAMGAAGLDRRDIDALEDLSDGEVLRRLGKSATGLARNERENVIMYLEAWASVIEERLSPLELARLRRLADARIEEGLAVAAEE